MKEITIICNPAAGSGKALQKWKRFQSELDGSNLPYKVFFTERPKHATDLTISAMQKGSKRIVSFGGDGTLNEILQGVCLDTHFSINDIDLVVLGAGSSNDFEKTFDKKLWIEKIQEIETKTIDIIKLDYLNFDGGKSTHYCINNSSIGIISEAGDLFNNARGLNKLIKKVSVNAGALIAGIQTILKFSGVRINLKIDEIEKEINSLCNITIYKNPFVAGDMYYNKCVVRDDGKLSVAIVESSSRFQLLKLIPSLYTGKALDRKGVNYTECKEIELKTNDNLVIEADGEIIGKPPIKYTVLNKAINVVV